MVVVHKDFLMTQWKDRIEEFISLVVVVFDTEAGTLRFASAGHPAAFLWHEREVRPLKATGPLLMLNPTATYLSREIPLETGDMILMYTDGLAEVRNGEDLFGEDRIAQHITRDPGMAPDVLAKTLLESARYFSREAIEDEIESLTRAKVETKYLTLDAILIRDVTLPLTLRAAIEQKLKQEQEALEYDFRIQKEQKEAERKKIEANGIAEFQKIVNRTITPQLLRWKGVEATQEISKSQNSKVCCGGITYSISLMVEYDSDV